VIKRRVLTAAVALACMGVAVGCGGSDGGSAASGAGAQIDVELRLADCTDWKRADVSERLGTVRRLRDFAGGPTGSPSEHGNVLADKQAYQLFENWCGNYYARGFKLYKLYTRAAAFSSLVPEG
jgi:hypothetical protein